MTMERDKEREWELEGAMYTNCLLLGLDLSALHPPAGQHRLGLFRHSNPKLGEQLLYFLLSSVRGPAQSAKDFDKLWPIFDSAQSRDFRKVVQSIISELESQGALPRSNSRVSSLATCCGPRFVELLWQLSVHALREVHRRTFADDVAATPLPASLTDSSYSHAPALLPVTKARIALERRKFLKTANTAVQTQATWASLAQEITAEFRGLCVEEAYLQQELEKIQDLRTKSKLDGELWDDRGSLSQNSHMVSKATRLWESLLARKSQHEVLASGPIEDLIAHREHRYRISGSALLAAMDQNSQVNPDLLSDHGGHVSAKRNGHEITLNSEEDHEISDASQGRSKDESVTKLDERSGRIHPTVDIAEVLRRWTHALQRIHKQAIHLAKANDGEGPDLLRSASDVTSNGHAESLSAALSEHSQHLASIEAFVNQLKEVVPTMEESLVDLTEEVNGILNVSSTGYDGRSTTPNQAHLSGRFFAGSSDEVLDITSKLSSVQLETIPPIAALKLPQLFSSSPNLSTKSLSLQNGQAVTTLVNKAESLRDSKIVDQPSNDYVDNSIQGCENSHAQSIRRSVREAALLTQVDDSVAAHNNKSDGSLEHYFVPFEMTNNSIIASNRPFTSRRKQRLFAFPDDTYEPKSNNITTFPFKTSKLDGSSYVPVSTNGFLSVDLDNAVSNPDMRVLDVEESPEQIFSPPLLMDVSGFGDDAYEDLLAPISELDAALMEN